MEHQHHLELQQIHSPREKYQLNDQLGHFQSEDTNFESNNPFSYYDEGNKRQSISSEDEAPEDHHSDPQINNSTKHDKSISNGLLNFTEIEVSENLTNKPAIIFGQIEKITEEEARKKVISTLVKPEISLLKQKQIDFTKLNEVNNIYIQATKKVPKSPQGEVKSKLQDNSLAQRNYKQQIDNDLQTLKKSFKNKQTKKKSKIFDFKQESPPNKAILNKTYAPGTKKNHENDNDMELEEIRMLIKMAFEKKKANYEMLKQWDRKRAQNMALHGKMIELLQNQIDLRIKSSLQNFENYQTFFKQKARQQQKYVTSPVINTRYALQNNSLSRNVYINCSVILNSLCDQNTNRCKKINDFILLIRTNILKQLTQNHLSSSQKQLLKVRQKISTLKSSLKKYNQQTQQKTVQLGNLFKEQSNNITNKCEKDFYRTQLSFLRKAIQQIQVQKKLGQYCLQYYHTAVQQELKRSSVIREAMMTYSRGLKQTYNLETQCLQIEQMSKNEELKLIEQFFCLEQMFDERTIELFKLRNRIKGDVTIQNFTSYINNFNYELFDSRVILLKEFHVKYITQLKGKQVLEQACYLIITVDNFLHLSFNYNKNVCCKPDITIKISNKSLEVKAMKDQFIDIIKKEQKRNSMMSYFWDNKLDKTYRVRFSKKDNKEQFMDYITKLMIDS